MQAAIDGRQTAKAYRTHEKLLDEHPGLIKNEQLAEKVLQISQAEAAVVKFVSESRAASTDIRPSQIVAELALANRTGKMGLAAGSIAVRVSGAVYGFDTSDGSLRWRRFVGMAPTLTPVMLDGGDLLVVDAQYNELLRLSGRTGKLVWRHAFESEVTKPIVHEERILINEASGKLHVLDLITGERTGYVQFAQRLSSSPAVGGQGKRIFVVGEHSSLYTLSSTDYSCLGGVLPWACERKRVSTGGQCAQQSCSGGCERAFNEPTRSVESKRRQHSRPTCNPASVVRLGHYSLACKGTSDCRND